MAPDAPPNATTAHDKKTASGIFFIAEHGTSDRCCRSTAYPFPEIEKKWQQHWQDNKTFATPHFSQLDKSKPKFYVLDM